MKQRNMELEEPTRDQRLKLSSELVKRFGFTKSQGNYLAVQSFGYCTDVIDQIKKIESNMRTLKKVLEDLQIL